MPLTARHWVNMYGIVMVKSLELQLSSLTYMGLKCLNGMESPYFLFIHLFDWRLFLKFAADKQIIVYTRAGSQWCPSPILPNRRLHLEDYCAKGHRKLFCPIRNRTEPNRKVTRKRSEGDRKRTENE